MITVLAGGVGAARFLRGLVAEIGPTSVTAIVNVADDFTLHGLSISPDLDTVRYTLAGEIGSLGWGRADETNAVMDELSQLARVAPATSSATDWFTLGDKDLATHLYRSQRRAEGATLSRITHELCRASNVEVRLLPVSDDPIRTIVELESGEQVSFQHYFVALRHAVAIRGLSFEGLQHAKPAPLVLDSLRDAERIVIAPSNPFVSLAPVLGVAEVASAVEQRREQVVAVSPIVAGRAIKGPAADMLGQLGYECSVASIARLWSPHAATLVIDEADADRAKDVEAHGMRCITTDTIMRDIQSSRALAAVVSKVPLP
jgi:LPPG:FO 2-phospho-L-lactate transferase